MNTATFAATFAKTRALPALALMAALLAHEGSARATQPDDATRSRVQSVLEGTSNAAVSTGIVNGVARGGLGVRSDTQEQTRKVLAGEARSRSVALDAAAAVTAAGNSTLISHTGSDTNELTRRVLLGRGA